MNAIKAKTNEIYLISKWSDINESIMLSISAKQVNTYEDLICHLNHKDKEFRLWVIFEIINETVDLLTKNSSSSYEYDDSVDKLDSSAKRLIASSQKKDKEKTIQKFSNVKTKFIKTKLVKKKSKKSRCIKKKIVKLEVKSSQIIIIFVRWNILIYMIKIVNSWTQNIRIVAQS